MSMDKELPERIDELYQKLVPDTWSAKLEDCDDGGPDCWRVVGGDDSIEATLCELWSGEHDNEAVAKLIAELLNNWLAIRALLRPTPSGQGETAAMRDVQAERKRQKATAPEVAPSKPGTPFAAGLFCHNLFDEKLKPYTLIVSTIEGDLGALTHKQALDKVAKLKIGGKKDWRLPTRAEALAMRELLQDKIDDTADALQREWYWTSQQFESDPDYAWIQGFFSGYQDYYRKSNPFRARAVRRESI